MKSSSVVLTLASLVFLMCVPRSQTCNKALCASDVSKCLIQVGLKGLLLVLKHTVDSPHTVVLQALVMVSDEFHSFSLFP
ncbi:putative twisted gastrulation protein [Cricetulus griseus]|uniref:Putative twisted gastrulation protein n=1 Tax=Cricetulus griseus TaxID=10029 RepID=A0A061IDE5_CRIGR|nr:putative twisted gastrulation protein [Cricetulus griseus]